MALEALAAAVSDGTDKEIEIELVNEEGVPTRYKGLMPTSDQMVLFMASTTGDPVEQVSAVVGLVEDTFGDDAAGIKRRIRNRRDPLTFEMVTEAIVEAVSDFPTEPPSGSIIYANTYWKEIDGACAQRGFNPLDLSLRRFTHLVYTWLTERLDEDGLRRLKDELDRPLRDPDSLAVRRAVCYKRKHQVSLLSRLR